MVAFWLIMLAVLFMRVGSATKDGLSHRATVSDEDHRRVSWIGWHVPGWVGRDLPQAILICTAAYLAGFSYLEAAMLLAFQAALNLGIHEFLYNWAVRNRIKFVKDGQ